MYTNVPVLTALLIFTRLSLAKMKENRTEKIAYQAPKLVEYGDIRKLTAAACGFPGAMDSMYYLGYINNLSGECTHNTHHNTHS